jgi:hypothetical protein
LAEVNVFYPCNAFKPELDEDNKRPNHLHIECIVQNYGRTPAIIEATNFNMAILNISQEFPAEPVYNSERTVAVYEIIGDQRTEPQEHIFFSDDIRNGAVGMLQDKVALVFGFIQDRDISGRRYPMRLRIYVLYQSLPPLSQKIQI